MQAVVFDLFGTLVPEWDPVGWDKCVTEIAGLFGTEPAALHTAWNVNFPDRMNGTHPDDDFVFVPAARALRLDPGEEALRGAAALRMTFMRTTLTPKPDALACLHALRDAGYRLAVATDCSSGTPALLGETPLAEFFEVRAASALLGAGKPDPIMYRHVLDGLGLDGGQCVYIGDGNSAELPGAKRHGMTTVWVDNGEDQRREGDRFVPEGDYTIRALSEIPPLLGRI